MAFLKLILIALLLLVLAVAGLAIKMLFKKDGKFPGGSCSVNQEGFSCSCGAEDQCENKNNTP